MRRKQLFLNISANFISVFISMAISFFLTPFIVKTIGKEAYSFVPISSNFLAYMGIFTVALTSMSSRFISLKIHGDDIEGANNYYSTSFYTSIYSAIVILILSFFVLNYLEYIIQIPSGILFDVKLLFLTMFLSFVINIATISFSISAFCMNRLDITNTISILGSFVRIMVLVILFKYFKPMVYYIGISSLAITLFQGLANYFVSKRILPILKISYCKVKTKIALELFSSGIWNSFGQLSSVLLTGLDLLIANIVLGASSSGTLAVAKAIPLALQTLISVLPTAFYPYLTILYAKESKEKFIKELHFTLKFTSIFVAIPIAGYIVLCSSFFSLWVPSVANSQLTLLSILTMISMVASFSLTPLVYIFAITNKLKWPSIAIFIVGISNVVIVLLLVMNTNFGLYAIAGISSILEMFRFLIFVPIYAAICLNEKKSIFYPSIFKSLVYIMILILIYSVIIFLKPVSNWLSFILTVMIMGIIGVVIGLLFMLNSDEKRKIREKIFKKV